MAGVELATAYYSLVPSMAGTAAAVRGQSAALTPVWSGIGDDAGKGLKGGLLASVGRLAAPMAAAFAAIGIGSLVSSAVDTVFESVDLASSAAEMTSAIGVLYGDAADDIESFAERSVSALGLTRLESLGAAKDFGLFAKAAGLSGDEMALFATDLTGLAADMASFNDTSIEEAITAISAGLRGESEPLRQYGVLLDDATLKARAMSLGIYDGNGALTQQQRVLAAQAEIFAQTTAQQGDAVRTGDQLAGQQKRLAAAFEEAQIKLGTALLPAMTQFTTFANDKLVPIINDLVTQVGPVLGDALAEAGPAFADLLIAVAPLIPEVVRLASEALPPLIAAFKQVAPVILDITTNSGSMWSVLNGLFSFLSGDTSLADTAGRFLNLKGSTFDALRGVIDFASGSANAVASFAREVGSRVQEAIGFFRSLPSQIQGLFAGAGSWLVGSGRDLIQGFVNGIKGMVGAVGDAVGSVLSFARGFFPNSPADRGPFSGAGWRQIANSGAAIFDQFTGGFDDRAGSLAMPGVSALAPRVSVPRFNAAISGALGGSEPVVNQTTNIYPQETDPYTLGRVTGNQIARNLTGLGVRK